jgi:hypothetical protein
MAKRQSRSLQFCVQWLENLARPSGVVLLALALLADFHAVWGEESSAIQGGSVTGDINADGSVNAEDVTLALWAVAGMITLTPAQSGPADVDGNHTIDIADATWIRQKAAGVVVSPPSPTDTLPGGLEVSMWGPRQLSLHNPANSGRSVSVLGLELHTPAGGLSASGSSQFPGALSAIGTSGLALAGTGGTTVNPGDFLYLGAVLQDVPLSGATFVYQDAARQKWWGRILVPYSITASAGAGGSIAPSGNFITALGDSQTFTANPFQNNQVNTWWLDGSVVQTGGLSYTLANIQANHTVMVTFAACSYGISPSTANHGAGAESGSFDVTAAVGCTWSATPSSGWIHTGSSGNGSGLVSYTVDPNPLTSPRGGSISVQGQLFQITQTGQGCSYGISGGGANHGAGAESGSFDITAGVGCTWSATPGFPWIHTSSSSSGNGRVTYTVDSNASSSARAGSISVQGLVFSITQAGQPCSYAINPVTVNHGPSIDSGSFGVSAPYGCQWTASATSEWIHTSSTGNGDGAVAYLVDANSSTEVRVGTVTVQGQPFTIVQAGLTSGISTIPDQQLDVSTSSAPIPFKLTGPATSTPALAITGHSSNPELIAETNIWFGGTGSDRYLLLIPTENRSGTTRITISLPDPAGGILATSFLTTVGQPDTEIQFDLTTARVYSDGRFECQLSAPAGRNVVVQYSTEFIFWVDLCVLPNPTGTVTVTDTPSSASGLRQRFYRAKWR